MGAPGSRVIDWLDFARRVSRAGRAVLEEHRERASAVGRGRGGDMTLTIDRAVEDVVFEKLVALEVGLVAISEERGRVELGGGGDLRVVIDPIDGSLNAKRSLPPFAISLAVARGSTMADVDFGYVSDLSSGEEWWAHRGGGAFHEGRRLLIGSSSALEILGVESSDPQLVDAASQALARSGAHRLRMVGSIALALCYVGSSRFDGLLSLRAARSVDAAAGQLIAREAGAYVSFPDAGGESLNASLSLEMRSRVVAAASAALLSPLLGIETGG